MASYDPEFQDTPKFYPEYDESRGKQRGCFFYGCVIASILAVLLMILIAVATFLFYRMFTRVVDEWTSPAPVELPRVEATEEERKEIRLRVDEFRDAIKQGTAVEPLVLTSDDLNTLLEENEDFRGRIHAKIEGDRLKAQLSLPLETLADMSIFKGRYLNGEAILNASLSEGVLIVTIDSIQVNGKPLPEQFMNELRAQNLAKDAYKNQEHAEMFRRFESIQIKDDTIILTPRPGLKPMEESDEEEGQEPKKIEAEANDPAAPAPAEPPAENPEPSKPEAKAGDTPEPPAASKDEPASDPPPATPEPPPTPKDAADPAAPREPEITFNGRPSPATSPFPPADFHCGGSQDFVLILAWQLV